MKKLLQLNIILLTLLLIFSTTRIILNNYYITNHNKKILDILKKLNITEKYIIYYNEGNTLLKERKYKQAIKKYEIALQKSPKKKHICYIKINLAYSKINSTNNYNELTNIKKSLLKDHCYNKKIDKIIKQKKTTKEETNKYNDNSYITRQEEMMNFKNNKNYNQYNSKYW